MERRLFIIRHGKSSWEEEGLDDIDRPLAERGTRNADTMARRLSESGCIPELIYSSPANRALSTASIMSGIWGIDPAFLQIHDALYMAYVSEIEQVVSAAPNGVMNLAIFGHNPSFTLYANHFLDEPLDNLPTAGVVVVTLESDGWKGIGRPHVRQTFMDYPKRQPKELGRKPKK
ncbi:MAG: histidine phosphatase family protein [Bacteroidales bacterium]|nr:histidine phosphatase family protein [Bacteroidales bacterium]